MVRHADGWFGIWRSRCTATCVRRPGRDPQDKDPIVGDIVPRFRTGVLSGLCICMISADDCNKPVCQHGILCFESACLLKNSPMHATALSGKELCQRVVCACWQDC